MLDKDIIADEISLLLKTKYVNTRKEDKPFDLAFTEIADKHHIMGNARGTLKSEIGTILAKRPRKPKAKKKSAPAKKTEVQFCVMTRNAHMVEFVSRDRLTFRFLKNLNGSAELLSYSGAHLPSALLRKAAEVFAKEFFQNRATWITRDTPKPEAIVKKESSATRLVLMINNTFEALFVPTDSSIAAHITRGGETVRQKDVPSELMKKARAVAITYFRGASTLPLDFG